MNRAQRPLFSPPPSHNSFLGALSFTPHLELISCNSHTYATPAVMYCREQKIRLNKIRTKTLPKGTGTHSFNGDNGLYLSRRIWSSTPAPPTPPPPPQARTAENKKIRFRKIRARHCPKGTGTHSLPSGGWRRILPRWQSLIRYLVGDRPYTGKLASPAGKLPDPIKHLRRVGCRIDRDFH
ncbi:hypothetical protein CEXT_111731 [Caerostris extrusa]|uniref:Uncharacterized protein n=1 Tax=Caerostris extrusa TaxID=172846 RepID=A0AAV4Q063_CAEEX|nr:hypothetical protein CEXT_111731 [Caerostris extrusa]